MTWFGLLGNQSAVCGIVGQPPGTVDQCSHAVRLFVHLNPQKLCRLHTAQPPTPDIAPMPPHTAHPYLGSIRIPGLNPSKTGQIVDY
jgi:hypothetical protein